MWKDSNMTRTDSLQNMCQRKHITATSRRGFLKGALAASAFTVLPREVLGGPGRVSPADKTTLACIGLGGQGQIDLFNLLQLRGAGGSCL